MASCIYRLISNEYLVNEKVKFKADHLKKLDLEVRQIIITIPLQQTYKILYDYGVCVQTEHIQYLEVWYGCDEHKSRCINTSSSGLRRA